MRALAGQGGGGRPRSRRGTHRALVCRVTLAGDEQTSVPHIYAIGDCIVGVPELTPAAIKAGKLLSQRLYGGSTAGMDYERIATTVFTPMEYGAVGLSEEAAIEKFGAENVEVYHSKFSPLEHKMVDWRHTSGWAKVVCNKRDAMRIVGLHYTGPHAGELTQGFATALRLGATFDSLKDTVGIHPTAAEEFTVLS